MTDRRLSRQNSTLRTSLAAARRFEDSRRKPIARKARLRPVGRRGKRRRENGEVFGPLAEMVRMLRCDICGKRGPSDPHHVRSRGAGYGDFLPNGDGNLVALCREHHRLVESERERWRDALAERAREHGEAFRRMRE